MKYKLLTSGRSERLILFFAGWAMDYRPFVGLVPPEGYDLAVVWDYSDLNSGLPTDGRSEICVVAWSYGVFAAHCWLKMHPELPATRRTAVGGTLFPKDIARGIDPAMFDATLRAVSDASLPKFYRRMAGSSAAYAEFMNHVPQRTASDAAAELDAIGRMASSCMHGNEDIREWDTAYITGADRIFPPEAQRSGWQGCPTVTELEDSPHLPPIDRIIRRAAVAKRSVGEAFGRTSSTYSDTATVQTAAARRLARLWADAATTYPEADIIEIGAGAGALTDAYTALMAEGVLPVARMLVLVDIAPLRPSLPGQHILADGETFMMDRPAESADAIVSASTIQWFNSPRRFIREAARVLRPGGVLAIAVFGHDNYKELRPYAEPPVTYFDDDTLKAMLPACMEVLAMEQERSVLTFPSPRHMLEHIRLTGVSPAPGPDDHAEAATAAIRIVRAGLTKLTYHPLLLLARKR